MTEAEANEESVWILKQSEVKDGLSCEPCKENDIHVEADGFCSDCNEFLCCDCRKAHRRNKTSKQHVIMDKDKMPHTKPTPKPTTTVDSDATNDTCTEKCDTHPLELIKYFCNNHGCLGCSACITVDHRACDDVSYIPDIAAGMLQSQQYKHVAKELEMVKGRSEIVATNAKSNVSHAEQHSDQVIKSVQGVSERACAAFIKLDKTMALEINQLKIKDIETLNHVSEQVSTILEEIGSLAAVIEHLRSTGQLCQLFIVVTNADEKLRTWNNSLDEVDTRNRINTYEFEVMSVINDITSGNKNIGKLTSSEPSAKRMHQNVEVVRNLGRPAIQKVNITNPLKLRQMNVAGIVELEFHAALGTQKKRSGKHYTIQHLYDIDEKSMTSVHNSQITGSALLPDDKLVIADADQQKIKLVNLISGSVISDLNLSSRPYDVAAIGQQEVAVAMPSAHKIIFVKIITNRTVIFVKANDGLAIDREIRVKGQCRGLAFQNDQLFVSFTKPPKVEILSLNGTIQHEIRDERGPNARMIWPHYIALSADGTTLYVSDYDDNSVKALNLDGSTRCECRDVSCPTGIAVDCRGNILLVENFDNFGRVRRNESLIVLTEDCKMMDVVEAGFYCPRSLSYCARTGRLFVGQYRHTSFGNHGLSVHHVDQAQRFLSA